MTTQPTIEFVGSDPANRFNGRAGHKPQLIVSHVMMGTMRSTADAFHNPAHQASAHYGISKTGQIDQYVDLDDAPFANGPIRNPQVDLVPLIKWAVDNGVNANYLTVAVEWEGIHKGTWQKVSEYGVYTMKVNTWWEPTEAQVLAGIELYGWLCETLNIPVDRAHLCRHSDFDHVVKAFCPGQRFPLGRIITTLGGTL